MRGRLLKDVSMAELTAMREQGYSNAKIAELLGVTYKTIYNALGPQNRKAPVTVSKEDPPKLPPTLKKETEYHEITFTGKIFNYTVDLNDRTVHIQSDEEINIHEIDQLIQELCYIRNNFCV